jgi:branched-chain amino acid transport system substrate-binding protein
VLVAGAAGASAAPGAGPAPILVGGTASLADPAAPSAAVARGAAAYFAFVNARGGVRGRAIEYRVLDDGRDPEVALDAARQLVEQDRVLAVLGPSGEGADVRAYLDAAGVPRLLAAPGARWPGGAVGLGPSPRTEGSALAAYLALTRPRAQVAVLASAGGRGRDLLAAFRRAGGLGVRVVAVERVDLASPELAERLAALESSGADVLAVLGEPGLAAGVAAAARRLAWRPLTLASVLSGSTAEGTVSVGFLKEPTDPAWSSDGGLRLYRTILARYARGADARDVLHVYGMAAAHALVEVLERAGTTPTRVSVLERLRSVRVAGSPFVLPGVVLRTGPRDPLPVEQLRLQRREGGRWRAFGGLFGAGA